MKFSVLKMLVAAVLLTISPADATCNPCPSFWGYFDGYCYRYFGQRATWSEAQRACRAIPAPTTCSCESGTADLASIHSVEENTFVYELFRVSADIPNSDTGCTLSYGIWLGLYQTVAGSTGPFLWSDNSSMDYESWISGQPSNHGGDEDCGHFWRRDDADDRLQSWNDARCSLELPYVCKAPAR